MPNRIIKESIWTSANLNLLSPLAERYFYRLLPLPDDFGCCELTPLVVKGRIFPLRTEVRVSDIEKWNSELEKNGLVRFWSEHDRLFGVFVSWEKHQRIRSLHQRRTPIPPPIDNTCRQMTSGDGLNPNPNPNPNPNKRYVDSFGTFWTEYPQRNGKKVGKAEALKAWNEIKPDETLQKTILTSLKNQKENFKYLSGIGEFVAPFPDPHRWLKKKRWEDEVKDTKELQHEKVRDAE